MKCRKGRKETICAVFLDGLPHTKRELETMFRGTGMENLLYRISTYIYSIKKAGGKFEVIRHGREVEGYRLLNPKDFDSNGRYIGDLYKPVLNKLSEVKNEAVECIS